MYIMYIVHKPKSNNIQGNNQLRFSAWIFNMDVKKGRGGVITHKNVFVPRHVLFLGLVYSFFLGGTTFELYFFIGLLKHEVQKMHTFMLYLF
jgi:hypothetical protein